MEKQFQTEVSELLKLVINSLYSNRDIFLRELVSNSSDAIDKVRFNSLSDKSLDIANGDLKIKIIADKDKKTFTVIDNGVGMTETEVEENIGTIAHSGTKSFVEKLQSNKDENTPDLIGQFGVGFYSAFMVADKVDVYTRSASADKADGVHWHSEGTGSYTIDKTELAEHGTKIVLHLKEDAEEYLEDWKIRKIVKTYSDFLSYPITMDVEKSLPKADEDAEPETTIEEETLNSMKAIWTKAKADVTDVEYKEFYRHISQDHQDPAEIIHYRAEGNLEFDSLLFVPDRAPMDMFMQQENKGISLYVKRVFIMDDCKDLIPDYLRFVKGVVDSADLPLNVSREILQEDRVIRTIRKNIVKKVISTLKKMKNNDFDKYSKFWQEFGKVLKEGVSNDWENKDKLTELLIFESSSTEAGKFTSLDDYVKRMPEDQKEIYYISGLSRGAVENSPQLEAFKKKGFEVLFFIDPIDEWVTQSLTEFDTKAVKSVAKGDLELDEKEKEELEKENENFKTPLESIQKVLDDEIKEVRFSSRLTDSPCCLVADENGMGVNMENIYKAMNQDVPHQKRTLELNKDHAVVQHMLKVAEKDAASDELKDYSALLYDQALLNEGSAIKDPARFTSLITKFMVKSI
ncbi:molecular chaperone HtpG [Lentisphaera profundi]|uniref:Chaperone protein HtpG n=1 Tax=Lentisphaera profundi TaxID=1658616 RepID=A0ABY7VVL2_9BACT|nr:molecular chaperone HtpG [Lentisphaera profundi]WDE96103.1 molecular chaperone HtpG [Lentisphaera profundi]